jgi:hypothetical protein
MLGGHILSKAHRTDTVNGMTIHSIFSDCQEDELGVNGILPILIFDSAANRLSVQTCSPTTKQYLTNDANLLSLDFDLIPPFARLSQQTVTIADGPWPSSIPTWMRTRRMTCMSKSQMVYTWSTARSGNLPPVDPTADW